MNAVDEFMGLFGVVSSNKDDNDAPVEDSSNCLINKPCHVIVDGKTLHVLKGYIKDNKFHYIHDTDGTKVKGIAEISDVSLF